MIWESLKIGLKKCHLKTKLKIVCSLFFLCSVVCFSQSLALNAEQIAEIEKIQDPVVLRDIINLQNQQVIELETTLNLVDQGLIPLLTILETSRQNLTLAEKEASLLNNQLTMLSITHQNELKVEYWRGFKHGAITFGIIGISVGGAGGYGIGFSVGSR